MAPGRSKTFRLAARGAIAAASVACMAVLAAGCSARCATSSPVAREARIARCDLPCPARSKLGREGGACACASGLDLLQGACVTPAEAAAFCGTTASWNGHACVARDCPGSAPDATTGACVPALRLRALVLAARSAHDGPDDRASRPEPSESPAVRCREGHALVVRDDQVTCVPEVALCPREAVVDDGACTPPLACGVGEVASSGRCAPLVTRGRVDDPFAIDVGTWATALLGPDGGDGTRLACAALAAAPTAFGPTRAVRVAVDVILPDNDVTRLVVRVSSTDAETHRPVPPAGARIARLSIESLTPLLRALGGTSTAASLSRTLLCPLPVPLPPSLVRSDTEPAPIEPPADETFD